MHISLFFTFVSREVRGLWCYFGVGLGNVDYIVSPGRCWPPCYARLAEAIEGPSAHILGGPGGRPAVDGFRERTADENHCGDFCKQWRECTSSFTYERLCCNICIKSCC